MAILQELLLGSGVWSPYLGGGVDSSAVVSRDSLDGLEGTYEPSYETTGLLPGFTYDTTTGATNLPLYHAGDWTITEAVASTFTNRTIEGYKVDGRLTIQAPNVTVKNCWVRGTASPGNGNIQLVDTVALACTNFVIKDSVLIPQTPTYGWNAIGTHDYTAIRVYTKWTVDSFRSFPYQTGTTGTHPRPQSGPVNTSILACFAEELAYFSPDPNHPNDTNGQGSPQPRTHNDIIQVEGGSGLQIIGNKFVGKLAGADSSHPLWPNAVYGTSGTDAGSKDFNLWSPYWTANPPNPTYNGYNYGRFGWTPSTSILQIVQNVGQVTGMLVDKNWVYAGATQFNASNGGTYPPSNTNLGVWSNNLFDLTVGQTGNNIAYGVDFTLSAPGNFRTDSSAAGIKTQTS